MRDEEDTLFPTDPIVAETAATLLSRTEAIAQHLAAYLRQTDPLAKTIVFCVDQHHAEQMREALERACADYVTRYRGYIERIVSDEGAEGKRALGRFSTPAERTPVIVTTSRLLSTGIDVPTCKNIVLARPVGSLVEFKQIIGRGSRLYEPEKTWFTIIDYAGATNLFFDPNFDGDPELVEIESLTPQLQSQPEEDTVVTGTTGGTPAFKEGSTISLEGQHLVQISIPLLPTSLGSPVSQATTDKQVQHQDATGAPAQPPENAPIEIEPPTPGIAPAITQQSGIDNAPVEAQSPVPADEPAIPMPPALPEPHPLTELPLVIKQTRSGQTIQVIGEYVFDLGPDGKTLILHSSYQDYTATALKDIVKTPQDLRTRWLNKDQRQALRDQLAEEGVDLQALATVLKHPEVDPFDLLSHVAFGQQMHTRSQRVERIYREHADFINRYRPEAREMLKAILGKYIAGEAADISDPELLKVPPLSNQGTFIELARPFGGGQEVRKALTELQSLLYSA